MCVVKTFSGPYTETPAIYESAGRSANSNNWHALDVKSALANLHVDPSRGLTTLEVNKRRGCFGFNVLEETQARPVWLIIRNQFANVVIGLLAGASALAWFTQDHLEAIAILVVLVLNALVGFVTEWQANRALDALRRQTRTLARVRRDGVETTIDATELIPGDIIVLNPGDRVPADARLIEAWRLQTEESALTGESAAVEKSAASVTSESSLADRKSMLYLGTGVVAGRAVALVVAIGPDTELGKVGQLVATSSRERSELEKQLAVLGKRLVYVVLAIAAVVTITGWLRGFGLWVMTEVGISLAVAAVPEALPAVTTLILALGLLRMAHQRAIVRRLTAVETLGSTTVICADKTGTLTENRMAVREYYLSDGRSIQVDQPHNVPGNDKLFEEALRIGVLCNEAVFDSDEAEKVAIGDPTETALLVVADALVVDVVHERATHPKLAEQPFHVSTRRMTTLHRRLDGRHIAALKGAPGVVLDACTSYIDNAGCVRPFTATARARFEAANNRMASGALRVLGLAFKHFDDDAPPASDDDFESEYIFVGLVGMIDPPRPGVAAAIQRARDAGIRTVMLTGDQPDTALAIARELGLGAGDPKALHAHDLIDADKTKLAQLARDADVFARVSPENKLRIVEALQFAGEIVAVTGDGINDAPALKRANVGIAMGNRGTEVAKEAADVVLADDNFATIVLAIEGGRTIYSNIIKFVHLMLSKNLGAVLMIFAAIAFGFDLPLLPLQILFMNLLVDVFPALALALEPSSPDIMQTRSRDQARSLLSPRLVVLIGWQALMIGLISLTAYAWALKSYGPGSHSRTIALLVLIGAQLAHMFNCRSRLRSAFDGVFRNVFVWVAALIVISLVALALGFVPLARVLGTEIPSGHDWLVIILSSLSPILIVETTKAVGRRKRFGRGLRTLETQIAPSVRVNTTTR